MVCPQIKEHWTDYLLRMCLKSFREMDVNIRLDFDVIVGA